MRRSALPVNENPGRVRAAVLTIHPDIDPSRIDHRLRAMNTIFEDACQFGWERLLDAVATPDPNDRHVVAAGLLGRADAIVTNNLRDFPSEVLEPLGMHAVSADEFLLDALELNPEGMVEVLRQQAAATRRPLLGVDDVVQSLERAGASRFAHQVRAAI